MPDEVRMILRKKVAQLESERGRLDRQLEAIRAALTILDGNGRRRTPEGAPRKRRPMSVTARRAVGRRMKAYWAKRRAEKGKAVKNAK